MLQYPPVSAKLIFFIGANAGTQRSFPGNPAGERFALEELQTSAGASGP